MFYVRVYYRKCPYCGSTWAPRFSNQPVVRVGREFYVCKCGIGWPTGATEWVHLTEKQKRAYLVSTAEVGLLLMATVAPALFGYFIGPGWRTALKAGLWGLLVGVVLLVLFLWTLKGLFIALSLRRERKGQNHHNPARYPPPPSPEVVCTFRGRLLLPMGCEFPTYCVRCGDPPVTSLHQRQFKLTVPVCSACMQRYRHFRLLAYCVLALGLSGVTWAFLQPSLTDVVLGSGAISLGGIVGGAILHTDAGQYLKRVYVDDRLSVFAGAGPGLLNRLPQFTLRQLETGPA